MRSRGGAQPPADCRCPSRVAAGVRPRSRVRQWHRGTRRLLRRALSVARMAAERSPSGRTSVDCRLALAAALPNVRPPLTIDAAAPGWPIDRADAVLSINMVHISPWESALGLIAGAQRLLAADAPLILYGPWLQAGSSRRQATERSMPTSNGAIPRGGCAWSRILPPPRHRGSSSPVSARCPPTI